MITERSKLDNLGSREALFHRISQDYLTKEAPQFRLRSGSILGDNDGDGATIAECSERRAGIDPLERRRVIYFE
jgi:hypothetical protein